jgi:hypothetical protein
VSNISRPLVVGRTNIDHHLDGGKFFERTACSQAGRQGMKATDQGDLHAVSQKGDEDVGFDPRLVLMEDRANRQVAFEIAERLFDGDELCVGGLSAAPSRSIFASKRTSCAIQMRQQAA